MLTMIAIVAIATGTIMLALLISGDHNRSRTRRQTTAAPSHVRIVRRPYDFDRDS